MAAYARFPPIAHTSPLGIRISMRLLLSIAVLLVGLENCASASPSTVAAADPLDAPELARSFKLRERYGLSKPVGDTAIYIDSVAVHHTYDEGSTIAFKDERGHWQWSQASETGPGGLLPIERKLTSSRARSLSDSDAQSVERLIRDPALYSGTVEREGDVGIGAPAHVMGIVTPFGRTIIRWDGRLLGPAGELADILLGQ